jgi:SAM-dependent methyltransferase
VFRVLDVGDASGYLSEFDSELRPISLDIEPVPDPLPSAIRLAGDGTSLPFADETFDAVVSSDALEHVPPGHRERFLSELLRVSRDVVVLAAPFDTPGVAGTEAMIRHFVLLATGAPQVQLDEHRDNGLPDLASTEKFLTGLNFNVVTAGNGNLHDWLTMMLIKHQIAPREALAPLGSGYDLLYNALFAGREQVGPFYRHVIVACRRGQPDLGTPAGLIEGTPEDISAILAVGAATTVAEAVRQDTVPLLHQLGARLDDLGQRLPDLEGQLKDLQHRQDELLSHLPQLARSVEELGSRSRENEAKLDHLVALTRHPVRALGRDLRRRFRN